MKTNSATLVFLLGLSALPSAWAETDGRGPHHRMEKLQTELKLTDAQKQEIEKIFADSRPQLEALRKQGQELREKIRERVKTVLTPEQVEKFDKLHQERRERRKGGMMGQTE